MRNTRTPDDFARTVFQDLRRHEVEPPSISIISEIFRTLYYASLRTEEGQPIVCHLVYLDPDDPDPDPPVRIRNHRWISVPLRNRVAFTVPNLIKIAKASDPRTSSLAVYATGGNDLCIWGFVDQGNKYHDMVTYNGMGGFNRPGLFQASIAGVGHLIAYQHMRRIAELKVNTLVTEAHDVLRSGPVYEMLRPSIESFVEGVFANLSPAAGKKRENWRGALHHDWVATICRILLRIRNFKHGGALLIAPEQISHSLNIKYEISYSRLRTALAHHSLFQIESSVAFDAAMKHIDRSTSDTLPLDLYFDRMIAREEHEDGEAELDGAVWFVSLLSRVDGLVLLTPDLVVRGFGVEILETIAPNRVFRSTTATATKRSLQPVEYEHFGTRHRSMMRFCYHNPGALGLVVSQDGDVRVMTRLQSGLVVWDSIRLQYDDLYDKQLLRAQALAVKHRSKP